MWAEVRPELIEDGLHTADRCTEHDDISTLDRSGNIGLGPIDDPQLQRLL